MLERVLVGNRAHAPQAAFAVFERRAHAVEHVFTRQRIKLENAAAADNGRSHRDHRVFRCGADEADRPFFNRRQDRIALRLVPAVAFVEQQIGRLAGLPAARFRVFEHLAYIRHAAGNGVHFDERAVRRFRNGRRKRRLPAAGRAVKNAACQPVGLDGAAQQPPLPYDMLLPDEFVERARPHAVGQRCGGIRRFFHGHGKQVFHPITPIVSRETFFLDF